MTRKVASVIRPILTALSVVVPHAAAAQAFTGPGLYGGLGYAALIGGPSHLDAISLVLSIIAFVLDILTLVAVIVIIIAGIRLIVSMGAEEAKNAAKKTIIYAIIGLIVVLLSRIIVMAVVSIFSF